MPSSANGHTEGQMINARERNLALLVAGCFFMENLDATIVTTAAPRIAAALHVPSSATSIVITAYVLTLAVLIPISGWMSARFGARPVFLAAIVIFTLGSLGCAASPTLAVMVAMRVVQGTGGAMMVPVGRLVVLSRTAKKDLMRVISYIVWPALIAPVIAPLAGGLITTYASWHWLFLINIPLGVIAFAVAWKLIFSPPTEAPPRLDRTGVVLTCTGLAGLTYEAHLLSQTEIRWLIAAPLGAASFLLLVAAVLHLNHIDTPLLNLRTLKVHTFNASIVGIAAYLIPVGATPFLLPLLFEEVFGWTPVKAGAIVLFVFVGNIAIKPATTYLFNRWGFRTMIALATGCLSASMLACGLITAETPLALIVIIVLISGVARSVGGTGYSTMMFSDMPPEQMRDANALASTVMQLSIGLGVAIAAVLLRVGNGLTSVLPGHSGASVPYTFAFIMLALFALVPTVGALRLHPTAGDVLRTRAAQPSQARPAADPRAAQSQARPAADG